MHTSKSEDVRKLYRALWERSVINETPRPREKLFGHRRMIVVTPRGRVGEKVQ